MKKITRVIYKVDRHGSQRKIGKRVIILSDERHGILFNGKHVTKIDKRWIYYV